MAKREYKTATGKVIDFDTLSLKGEETIAVGNMGVNARGDKLGTAGEVVKSREEVMADYYRIHNGTIPEDKHIPDPDDDPTGPMDTPTADSTPIIEADNIPINNSEVITSDELAKALAETADEVMEDPTLRSAAAEVLAPVEKPTVKIADEEQIDEEVVEEVVKEVEEVIETAPRGGLASAVKKVQIATPVVEEKTAQQQVKEKGGVKRL